MDKVTVPRARLHPVLSRYALRRTRIPMGDAVMDLVLPDAHEWARRGVGTRFEPRSVGWEPPYWLQVWPAAVAMGRLLARRRLGGQRVLDLGCGVGVPGIAAARAGARVTFVDKEPDALAFASWNAQGYSEQADPQQQLLDWSLGIVDVNTTSYCSRMSATDPCTTNPCADSCATVSPKAGS